MATHVSLDVNGVRIHLYTETFCERQGIKNYWKVADVSGQWLVSTTVLSVGDLVRLAGVTDTFDYAVPQEWLNHRRNIGDTEQYIWIYPENSLYGEPMSHTVLWYKARENIFNAFLQQKESLEI